MKTFYSFLIFNLAFFVNTIAQVPFMSTISGPAAVCSAPVAKTYSTSATNSPLYFSWAVSPAAGVVIGNATANITTISFPNTSTAYTISCSATNSVGTSYDSTFVVSVFETPTVTFSGSNSFCQGSSTNISASPTIVSASSTLSYNWSPSTGLSSTNNLNVSANPAANTTYTLSLAIGTCTNAVQFPVTIDNTCRNVWPGDVNNDGIANNLDVLELGLHFNQTGPGRATQSNNWFPFYVNIWSGMLSNAQNLSYSDCNGDGIINSNDTAAIFYNYGFMHSRPNTSYSVNPLLTIVPDQASVNKGAWGTASVYLGDASSTISSINGLVFSLMFDPAMIAANGMYVEYPVSFLNASNQNLKFGKADYSSGMLYTAVTHTNNSNVSGSGKIAIIHYRINPNLTNNGVLTLGLVQAIQSNASGALATVTSGSASVNALITGIYELEEAGNISVYPNPANQYVTLSSTNMLDKIELFNVTGTLLLSEKASGTTYQLDLSTLATGVYFITVSGNKAGAIRKKIVVQK